MDEINVLYIYANDSWKNEYVTEFEDANDNINIVFEDANAITPDEFEYDAYNSIVINAEYLDEFEQSIKATQKTPPVLLVVDSDHYTSLKKLSNGFVDDIIKIHDTEDTLLIKKRLETIHAHELSKDKFQAINNRVKELFTAESVDDVAMKTVSAAQDIMGYEFVGFHEEQGDVLTPIQCTKKVREELGAPDIEKGSGIAWEAYRTGEIKAHPDVRDAKNILNEETIIRSEIAIPVNNFGVLLIGSTKINDFSTNNITILEILCQNAGKAIKQVKQKQYIEKFKYFVELSPDIVQIINSNGEITYQSEVSPVVSYNIPDFEGENILNTVVDDHTDRIEDELLAIENGLDSVYKTEYKYESDDGSETYWFEARTQDTANTDEIDGVIRTLREISERKETEEKLRAKNKKLDQFTSVITHDLRNPLGVAKGYTNLLIDNIDEDSDLMRYADESISSIDRMEEIITNMLTLTKSGDITGVKKEIDLGSVISDAWKNIESRNATIENNLTEVRVDGDKSSLQQCFENVLRNAIEHGGSDVTIRFDTYSDGVYVKDDGPGIDSGITDTIFEMGETTERSGTGYGLYITAKIIEEHGWDIRVNELVNDGARFDIELERKIDEE